MTQIRAFLTAAAAGAAAAVLAAGMPALAASTNPPPKGGAATAGGPARPKCSAQQIRMHQANCTVASQAHPQPGQPKGH